MALFSSISTSPFSLPTPIRRPITISRWLLCRLATLSSSSSHESAPATGSSKTHDSFKNPFTYFVIFDFLFLALLAVGGSLASSFLCFINGCVYIFYAYKVYWTSCVKGIHTGQMVLCLERPKWMKISSLELKTKVGHVIVMILLVKMFERSKMVTIATGMDLLSYSVCIFL
ncbi:hypothetical protein P3X46_024381 [Hevea brasiliensis]|uniref:Uncharacterized protein n=1 Tax=Hevea brasiliensis TaxID=3981 RepID=A0ABQ9L2B9_HEVBR|nr:hypothetical protein P3X46_024381 [Hevea brasiliensis]